jgi:hypothetical protein
VADSLSEMESRLVRIPRHLLHVQLDDLEGLGVPEAFRDAVRALLADLPLVPNAAHSAQLIGPPKVTVPALAVVARHVGQRLRDHNLTLRDDRQRLRVERGKLMFLDAESLLAASGRGDQRAVQEAALFVVGSSPQVEVLLRARAAADLVSFVATEAPIAGLAHWRAIWWLPGPEQDQ